MSDRSGDKFYRHEESGTVNVIYVPHDWPIEAEDDDFMGYYLAWGPTRLVSNDGAINTLWFAPEMLTHEVSERQAKEIHPALFAHLERVDRGEI